MRWLARPDELERTVMEIDPDCSVLGPDELLDRIAARAAAMAALVAPELDAESVTAARAA
jgi:hypothetical protein